MRGWSEERSRYCREDGAGLGRCDVGQPLRLHKRSRLEWAALVLSSDGGGSKRDSFDGDRATCESAKTKTFHACASHLKLLLNREGCDRALL